LLRGLGLLALPLIVIAALAAGVLRPLLFGR
jgi:hypothetical protein